MNSRPKRKATQDFAFQDDWLSSEIEEPEALYPRLSEQGFLGSTTVELLTIEHQSCGGCCPGSYAKKRLEILYRGCRYISRWNQEYSGKNEWTENFDASKALIHGFDLHPREAYQIIRLEFNPRFPNPLSDTELWMVILAADSCNSRFRRGRLRNNSDWVKFQPKPKAPQWMQEREVGLVWLPDSFNPTAWIRDSSEVATTLLTDFLVGVTSLRDQRKSHAERGGPPLHDHPMSMPEIGGALNRSADEVYDHFIEMQNLGLVEEISLDYVPGVYSRVWTPNSRIK